MNSDDAQLEMWAQQALEALKDVYSLDELIGFELVTHAADGTLSLTPLGYSIAVDCGWKVDVS